jgi:hypothetical protein
MLGGMPNRLRKKVRRDGSVPTLGEFAATLDTVAGRFDSARRDVAHERRLFTEVTGVELRRHVCAPNGELRHPHGPLCLGPAVLSARLWNLARLVRVLDDLVGQSGVAPPVLPRVHIRQKSHEVGAGIDVEGTIAKLVHWTHDHDAENVPRSMPAECIAYVDLLHENGAPLRPGDTRRKVAVRRALHELMDGRLSPVAGAIRALAAASFAAAGTLDALVQLVVKENPGVERVMFRVISGRWFHERRDSGAEDVDPGELPLPGRTVATGLAVVVVEMKALADELRDLDEEIRSTCLFAPSDRAPRAKRSERVLHDLVVDELAHGNFSDEEMADLVVGHVGGTLQARAGRIADNLDRRKGRSNRTVHVGPALTAEAPAPAPAPR